MGIASTKQALMSKPRLTLNKSARKSVRKAQRTSSLCSLRGRGRLYRFTSGLDVSGRYQPEEDL